WKSELRGSFVDRRDFLKNAGLTAAALAAVQGIEPWRFSGMLLAEDNGQEVENKNWADPSLGVTARASSHFENVPSNPGDFSLARNLLGEYVRYGPGNGWQTDTEMTGAWVEITFLEPRVVRELWILPHVIPDPIPVNAYLVDVNASTPRKIACSFDGGPSFQAELRKERYLQILTLPKDVTAKSLRIQIEEIWNEPGT